MNKRVRCLVSTGIAAALAAGVLATGTASAAEEPDSDAAMRAATQQIDAASAQVRVLGDAVASPADSADGPSTLTAPDGSSLGVALVGAKGTTGTESAVGTVYDDVLPATDSAVQQTDSGIRLMTVAENAGSPAAYAYQITLPPGTQIILQADGSANIVDGEGTVVGGISKPWAVDANGTDVPTHYTVDGSTLVQHVEHEGYAYPVVADPSISFSGGHAVITLNAKDQRILVDTGGAGAGMMLGVLCARGGPWAALGCGTVGVIVGTSLVGYIKEYEIRDNCDIIVRMPLDTEMPTIDSVQQVCH